MDLSHSTVHIYNCIVYTLIDLTECDVTYIAQMTGHLIHVASEELTTSQSYIASSFQLLSSLVDESR